MLEYCFWYHDSWGSWQIWRGPRGGRLMEFVGVMPKDRVRRLYERGWLRRVGLMSGLYLRVPAQREAAE